MFENLVSSSDYGLVKESRKYKLEDSLSGIEDVKCCNKEACKSNDLTIEVSINGYGGSQSPIVDNIEHYRNIFSTPDNFIKRRVDYSRMRVADEKYRMEKERLNSLDKFPQSLCHLTKQIARSGFYFIGNDTDPDKVKCIFCQGILFRWKKTDNPDKEHKKSFPTCPFLLNLNVGNEPIVLTTEKDDHFLQEDPDLKGISGRIQYNVINSYELLPISDDYIELDLDYREKTFENLDHLKHFSLDGLYITKNDDNLVLRCHKCCKEVELLNGIERLSREIFHYSNCEYHKIIKNEKLEKENKIKENNETENDKKNKKVTHCKVEYSITEDEIEARMDFGLKNKIDNLQIELRIIRQSIAINLKKTGKDYESIFDLLKDSKNFVEKSEEELTTNSLEFILPDYICVVCLDKPIEVVFLPCGHLKTCKSCSDMLPSCPVCRTLIEKRVWGIKMCHSLQSA